MATPIKPQQGHPVSYRTYSFGDLAKRAWGQEWGLPDVVYRFSNGAAKESTDMTQNGIYKHK